MKHWFDDLTKQLATEKPSRRTFVGGMAATLAVASTAGDWRSALAAAVSNQAGTQVQPVAHFPFGTPALPLKHVTATAFTPTTLNFGPCTVTGTATHQDFAFASKTSAAGKTVEIRQTRKAGVKETTEFSTTVLVGGTPQVEITRNVTKSGSSYEMTLGNAFGFKNAHMTSDGKTIHGTIDGKAVTPYTGQKTLTFANGAPLHAVAQPGFKDAISAGFDQATKDIGRCIPPAQITPMGHPRGGSHVGWYYTWWGAGPAAAPINMDSQLTPQCRACQNKCSSNCDSCVQNAIIDLIVSWGSDYSAYRRLFFGCGDDENNCYSACNQATMCNGVLCGQTLNYSISPTGTCSRGDVCVNTAAGYCCPVDHPIVCPGIFNTVSQNDSIMGNLCCVSGDVCVADTNAGYYKCCPKHQACGKAMTFQSSGEFVGPGHWISGQCCPSGTVCDSSGGCCRPSEMRNGKCCAGTNGTSSTPMHWCGDQCCSSPGCCNGKCCSSICLGGKTINGKCCPQAQVCGSHCCAPGQNCVGGSCKTINCDSRSYACTSTLKSGAGVTLCCEQGLVCCAGKCCQRGMKCCADASGTYACRAPGQCYQQVIK